MHCLACHAHCHLLLHCFAGQSAVPNNTGQSAQTAAAQPASTQPTAPATPASRRVATKSSVLVLQCLNSYAALLAPLPARQAVLWGAIAELFDNFFLACFILFSGVSLEALVWQEDLLPHRLRSALLRITTSKGCKYKAQVRLGPAAGMQARQGEYHKPVCDIVAGPQSAVKDACGLSCATQVQTASEHSFHPATACCPMLPGRGAAAHQARSSRRTSGQQLPTGLWFHDWQQRT